MISNYFHTFRFTITIFAEFKIDTIVTYEHRYVWRTFLMLTLRDLLTLNTVVGRGVQRQLTQSIATFYYECPDRGRSVTYRYVTDWLAGGCGCTRRNWQITPGLREGGKSPRYVSTYAYCSAFHTALRSTCLTCPCPPRPERHCYERGATCGGHGFTNTIRYEMLF